MRTALERELVAQRGAFVRKAFGERERHGSAPAQRLRSFAGVMRADARDRIERVAAVERTVARAREIDVVPAAPYRAQDASPRACKGRPMSTLVRFACRTGFHALV